MRNRNNRWESGYSKNRHAGGSFASRNTRPSNSRFSNKKRNTMSESDLIRSIEYSKNSAVETTESSYIPENSFEDLPIDQLLKQNIQRKGYKAPSPIQDQAILQIIDGKDLIGIANTGTGKTAAFLIPLIDKVYKNRLQKVLIVAPTRELAEQINQEFRAFVNNMNLRSVLIIGGKSMKYQIMDIRRNPNFIIGTPGRIKDLAERNVLNLKELNNVVLDETDRMVDIGFIKEIKYLISLLPKTRQSLFFSATVSKKVEEILHSFVQNPVNVSVKKRDTVANIKQDIIRVPFNQRKVDRLHTLLLQEHFEKVIVFGNTKWGVQKLADELVKRGLKAAAIHGDKRQSQRHAIIEMFKKNEVKVLLATDVAARGLDISNVSHVINYELPQTYDDYIHRIGRTGRADKNGVALTFIESN